MRKFLPNKYKCSVLRSWVKGSWNLQGPQRNAKCTFQMRAIIDRKSCGNVYMFYIKKKRTWFWMATVMPVIILLCVVGAFSRIWKSSFAIGTCTSGPFPTRLLRCVRTPGPGLQFLQPGVLSVTNFAYPISSTATGTGQVLIKCGSWKERTILPKPARIKHSGRWSRHYHLCCQVRRLRLKELRPIQDCIVSDTAKTWIQISCSYNYFLSTAKENKLIYFKPLFNIIKVDWLIL